LIEKNGIFTDLVHATGEGAAVLIAMAKEASERNHVKISVQASPEYLQHHE
jgi:thiazole synthase ThiGH ThiG subunit